jgi:hypothetical protein
MRRSLGILLLLAALTGCGSDDGSTAEDPTAEPTGDPTGPGWTQVALLSESEAGGEVDPAATPLPDEAAVAAFAGGFDERLGSQVVEAAGVDVPDGQELYGAVVALDCEPPTELRVARDGDDVVVTAEAEKASIQCLVPVTTVALVLVED